MVFETIKIIINNLLLSACVSQLFLTVMTKIVAIRKIKNFFWEG